MQEVINDNTIYLYFFQFPRVIQPALFRHWQELGLNTADKNPKKINMTMFFLFFVFFFNKYCVYVFVLLFTYAYSYVGFKSSLELGCNVWCFPTLNKAYCIVLYCIVPVIRNMWKWFLYLFLFVLGFRSSFVLVIFLLLFILSPHNVKTFYDTQTHYTCVILITVVGQSGILLNTCTM